MTIALSRDIALRLAREARERFVAATQALMVPIANAILAQLGVDAGRVSTARAMQGHRDDYLDFRALEHKWAERVQSEWHRAGVIGQTPSPGGPSVESTGLQLMDDDVVENAILASRLALLIHDAISFEFNDLRLRVQALEELGELLPGDVLRPDALSRLLVDEWRAVGLTRALWSKMQDTLCKHLLPGTLTAYKAANAYLIAHDVLPEVHLKRFVRNSAGEPVPMPTPQGLDVSDPGGAQASAPMTPLMAASQRARSVLQSLRRFVTERVGGDSAPSWSGGSNGVGLGRASGTGTGTGTGVDTDVSAAGAGGSPAFLSAIAEAAIDYRRDAAPDAASDVEGGGAAAAVQRSVADLRQRSAELKAKAPTTADKATVEIVALMFQAILSEDRIPFSARVWFARLQMPVLRVAIAEPEFFGTLQHPARMLIDRIGSCLLGFDAAAISGSALENEIRRVVQVIEQYPETGQRVFALVYDEFVAFLSQYLTQSDATQRLMSVAQQVEQKETMAIQYTIELRKMLNEIPVREEIREFLFKVWAEVLAIAALRYGAQDERTVRLKSAASKLVWAVSAKPVQSDRARVIHDLPQLLQRLREGMTLLGVVGLPQEAHIRIIGDTLADAFMSKTEAIPVAQIEAMTQRLANIEDFVGDTGRDEAPLDAASIELLLGVDAASLEVVPDTGAPVGRDIVEWARELQIGTWFMLDHNARVTPVQFVWRSGRKQLHLFASRDGRSFLIQAGRLGSYLQAGLLVPAEGETLTARATREALDKLAANPERLLS